MRECERSHIGNLSAFGWYFERYHPVRMDRWAGGRSTTSCRPGRHIATDSTADRTAATAAITDDGLLVGAIIATAATQQTTFVLLVAAFGRFALGYRRRLRCCRCSGRRRRCGCRRWSRCIRWLDSIGDGHNDGSGGGGRGLRHNDNHIGIGCRADIIRGGDCTTGIDCAAGSGCDGIGGGSGIGMRRGGIRLDVDVGVTCLVLVCGWR